MAYTKTPEQDTHNSFRIAPVGNQTFTSLTKPYEYEYGARYVNCYPIIRESKTKQPKVTLVKSPRVLPKVWVFPDNNAGVTDYDFETNLFVHNTRIYKCIPTGVTGPEIRLLYDTLDYNLKSCQKAIDYTLSGDTIIVGLCEASLGTYSYIYNYTQNIFTPSDDPIAVGSGAYIESGYIEDGYYETSGEVAVVRDLLVDGYHIVALKAEQGGTNRVLISNPGNYNLFYTDTDYFTPEIDPDNIVDIQKHKNMICVIGTHTIEFFYNAANELGSAFSRQDNYTLALGAQQNMAANNGLVSIAYNEDIYLLANSENGGNAFYVIRNFQANKISDDYIDYLLNDSTGITEDVPSNTFRLGMMDVMGNVMFAFELTNYETGYKRTFVFNERDMVWWEWKESDAGEFLSANYGPTSNINGHPWILDAAHLGVPGNTQFTIGTLLYEEVTELEVLPEYCPYGDAVEGETQELLMKFNTAPGTPLGEWTDYDLTDSTPFTVTTNVDWAMFPFVPSVSFPREVPYQNLGWLESAAFQSADVVATEPPYSTVNGNKFVFRAILPLQEDLYAEETYSEYSGLQKTYYFIASGYNYEEVQGAIKKFDLYLRRPNNQFIADGQIIEANESVFRPYLAVYLYDSAQGDGELKYNFDLSAVEIPVNEFGFVDATITLFLATDGNSFKVQVFYDIGEGNVEILDVDLENTISTPGSNQDNTWALLELKGAELYGEGAVVREENPNKICVFSVITTNYTPAVEPSLPTIDLNAYAYDQYTGIDYNILDLPTGNQTIIIPHWTGTNYDSYSLDVISGPATGNLDSGNALQGGQMVWSGEWQEQPIAPGIFAGVGTYVIRITATNTAGSVTDDVTITVNNNIKPQNLDAVVIGYTPYLSASPYIDYVPDLFVFALDAGTAAQFYFNNDGTIAIATDAGFLPDAGDYQWLSIDTGSGPTQPIDPAAAANYEIMASVYGPEKVTPPVGSSYTYYPFPWNWWASRSGMSEALMWEAVDGCKASGDVWDTWLSLDSNRVFRVQGWTPWPGYDPVSMPYIISFRIRHKNNEELNAGESFIIFMSA